MAETRAPVGIILGALVVVTASVMPWGTVASEVSLPVMVMPSLMPSSVEATATAWNSTAGLAGLDVPNWIVVPIAVTLVALNALRAYGIWSYPRAVDVLLALAGTIQTGAMLVLFNAHGKIGIGSLLSVLGFLVLLALVAMPMIRVTRPAPHPWRDQAPR